MFTCCVFFSLFIAPANTFQCNEDDDMQVLLHTSQRVLLGLPSMGEQAAQAKVAPSNAFEATKVVTKEHSEATNLPSKASEASEATKVSFEATESEATKVSSEATESDATKVSVVTEESSAKKASSTKQHRAHNTIGDAKRDLKKLQAKLVALKKEKVELGKLSKLLEHDLNRTKKRRDSDMKKLANAKENMDTTLKKAGNTQNCLERCACVVQGGEEGPCDAKFHCDHAAALAIIEDASAMGADVESTTEDDSSSRTEAGTEHSSHSAGSHSAGSHTSPESRPESGPNKHDAAGATSQDEDESNDEGSYAKPTVQDSEADLDDEDDTDDDKSLSFRPVLGCALLVPLLQLV